MWVGLYAAKCSFFCNSISGLRVRLAEFGEVERWDEGWRGLISCTGICCIFSSRVFGYINIRRKKLMMKKLFGIDLIHGTSKSRTKSKVTTGS
ncbi:hypothetical protein ACH3XW_30405 [Acanthocheilonema viteae]